MSNDAPLKPFDNTSVEPSTETEPIPSRKVTVTACELCFVKYTNGIAKPAVASKYSLPLPHRMVNVQSE